MSSATITKAINTLKAAVSAGKLNDAQKKEVTSMCRQTGVGVSKTRATNKEMKEKWMKSAEAKTLKRAFPKVPAVDVTAWSVATGKRTRPKYAEDSDAFDRALDYISDNLL